VNKAKDGGPAFPGNTPGNLWFGMSLRDWFAGQALAGLLSRDGYKNKVPKDTADWCYQIAAAMLAAREAAP
jgi:hypothetical protein